MLRNKKASKNHAAVLHILGAFVWSLFFILVSHNHASATAFIQSYNSSSPLQQGLVVQLNSGTGTVSPSSQTTPYQTFGVVVNASDAPAAISTPNSKSNQVYVTSTGNYNVLVSDQNGQVKAGSYVTLSSINGVAMQDDASQPIVVGLALNSFNGTSGVIGTDNLKTSSGTKIVHLGIVEVNISIAHNPLIAQSRSPVPEVLQKFTVGVSGKNDPAWRIYLGMAILLIIAVIASSMIYSAVRNSLISIGRNPLSKTAIKKGFIRVVLTALIIFISGIFGVYLLLKV